jgi:hypothetical protein
VGRDAKSGRCRRARAERKRLTARREKLPADPSGSNA